MAQEKKIEIISANSLDKDELLFPDANILKGSPNKQVHLSHDEMDIFSNNAIFFREKISLLPQEMFFKAGRFAGIKM